MRYTQENGVRVALWEEDDPQVVTVSDALQLVADACFSGEADAMILPKECLPETFFQLSTGFAGEVLQKFTNYQLPVAIVGDFSLYDSKSLRDFIYECNKGRQVYFASTEEEALGALTHPA